MNTKQLILEETFKSKFDLDKYLYFTKEFFNNITAVSSIRENEFIKAEYRFTIQSYFNLGVYIDPDKNTVDILAVKLRKSNSVERSRSIQRSFISKLLTDNNHDAAIVAFYNEDDERWRLSFVRLDYEFAAGKVKMSLTPAKRYSYLVGKGEPCHTAIDQLLPIFDEEKFNPTLDRIEEAFSVENVTKAFFDKYKEKYLELKEYLDKDENFLKEAGEHKFTSEQFAKKLMGQLAFLYFLQKKGWLGVLCVKSIINQKEYNNLYYNSNAAKIVIPMIYEQIEVDEYKIKASFLISKEFTDEEADVLATAFTSGKFDIQKWGEGSKTFVRDLFSACHKTTDKNFFVEYLEPLFYEALNHKRGKNNYYKRFNCKVPFLNGGLFEPLKNYDWQYTDFHIPNVLFSNVDMKGRDADGILDIFDRYNFTMNEDEPLEREIAVDPEMLGKIFENLLDVTDRKSKGAFYTPREIVHYMCQESIINYLITEVDTPYEDIKQFILYGEFMKDEDRSFKTLQGEKERVIPETVYQKLRRIDKALEKVRVADPAVGSGAFPLGMLSEIVKARDNITEYYVSAIVDSKEKLRKRQERSLYNLKWNTIKNCIYAVDIEASAVDIAKLRLWLSLIIDVDLELTLNDQDVGKSRQNEPPTLPNLDYNVMCGNSLIDEYEGIQFFDKKLLNPNSNDFKGIQMELFADDMSGYIDELFKNQDMLFGEQNPDNKKDIKEEIDKIIDNIIMSKLSLYNNEKTIVKYQKIRENGEKPFFVWELEFGRVFKEKGGFDIVIGNPPYFNVQTLGAGNETVAYLKKNYDEIWMDKSDILFYFIYKGYKISCGQVNFITSNAYLFSDKAKKLRNFMIEKLPLFRIVNFEKYMVFSSASITSCISFWKMKQEVNFITKALVFKEEVNNLMAELTSQKDWFDVDLEHNSVFALVPQHIKDINTKIDGNYRGLSEILKVGKGMETAANEVYAFEEMPPFPARYIRKRMLGENIKKYYYNKADEYLLYFEDVNNFDELDWTVKEYLEANRDILEKRATVKNEGRDWWRYSRPLHKAYYKYNKLWCSYRGKNNCFAYDDSKDYIGFTNTTVVFDTNEYIDIKYILALLNSSTLNYRYKSIGKQTGSGIFEFFENGIGKLPIPEVSMDEQKAFVKVIDEILEIKSKNMECDITYFERQIDEMVYRLYGLNETQIEVIKNTF